MAKGKLTTSDDVVTTPKPVGFGSGDFTMALTCLRAGGKVGREKWPKFIYLELKDGNFCTQSTTPNTEGMTWAPTHGDLLAKDWHSL